MAGYPFYTPRTSGPPPLLPTPTTDASRRMNTVNAGKKSRFMGAGNAYSISPSLPFPPPSTAAAIPPATAPSNSSQDAPHAPASQPTAPYPGAPPGPSPTPHQHVTIDSVRTAHVPALMRTTGLLLPVRYPNSFYSATITDPVIASVSRVAVYHDHTTTDTTGTTTFSPTATASSPVPSSDKVVGGIRCRLEPIPYSFPAANNLYIQTIHLLSPYRGRGVATSLLESIIYAKSPDATAPRRLSPIVKHYNIRSVTAHVHETNEDALAWYTSRGFSIQDGVVEGYYRRLKPGGAKIVKLDLNWEESRGEAPGAGAGRDIYNDDDDDDDWEKVEVEECSGIEKLEDYDAVDRTVDLDENARKRMKTG